MTETLIIENLDTKEKRYPYEEKSWSDNLNKSEIKKIIPDDKDIFNNRKISLQESFKSLRLVFHFKHKWEPCYGKRMFQCVICETYGS